MTYNVFGGMLNLAQSINHTLCGQLYLMLNDRCWLRCNDCSFRFSVSVR